MKIETQYISVTDTAKLIRRTLAKRFPGQVFSVKSRKYSGGASIDINWFDGPTEKEVESVTKCFQSRNFDGSIDMGVHVDSWLADDGSVSFAHTAGTQGSGGFLPAASQEPHDATAKRVSFGSNFVFASRKLSVEATKITLAEFHVKWGDCDDHFAQDGYVHFDHYEIQERYWKMVSARSFYTDPTSSPSVPQSVDSDVELMLSNRDF